MSYKQFLLSFTATALLVSPFAIHADDAPEIVDEIAVAPAFGESALVEGLNVSSVILKQDTKTATIRFQAKNNTKKVIKTEVVASLMQRPMTSPMARMVPMPSEIAQNQLALRLAPGETFSKTITVKLPAHVTAQLVEWERSNTPAAKKKVPQQQNLELAMLRPSAPSFFASVRAPAPAPTPGPQAKQVALK
jgi:hypothetical protein